jgi:mitofusin
MSGDYFSDGHGSGESSSSGTKREAKSNEAPSTAGDATAPEFMTVGTGTGPQYGAELQRILEADSGYGGSIASGSSFAGSGFGRGWHPGLEPDRPTPPHVPTHPGEINAAGMSQLILVQLY